MVSKLISLLVMVTKHPISAVVSWIFDTLPTLTNKSIVHAWYSRSQSEFSSILPIQYRV